MARPEPKQAREEAYLPRGSIASKVSKHSCEPVIDFI